MYNMYLVEVGIFIIKLFHYIYQYFISFGGFYEESPNHGNRAS